MTSAEKETRGKRVVGDGTPGPGRKKGVPNKTTTTLKEAILLAAGAVGEDGKGQGGLEGYLRAVAKSEPKSFTALLGRVLPTETRLANPDGSALEGVQVAPVINVTLRSKP